MNKNCAECVFYQAAKKGYTCGTCEYPVPEYLTMSSCKFISSPEYIGTECAVFKSRLDLIDHDNTKSIDTIT